MDVNELISSGLLELYVLGQVSAEERSTIEAMAANNTIVQEELHAIGEALEQYAKTLSQAPNSQVKSSLLETVKAKKAEEKSRNNSKGSIGWASILLLTTLGLLSALIWKYNQLQQLESAYTTYQENCDSIRELYNQQNDLLENINQPNNRIIPLEPTEKYPTTSLNFFYNPESKQNYLQIKALPPLAANQSYQLWSLKGDQAIPLDVFQIGDTTLLAVQFEDSTDAYAITIEPMGGSPTPTLGNLIGVIPVT
jgi:anti-sigma-K factor RskA